MAVGGCIGVGSEAKWNIGFLARAGRGLPRHRCPALLRSRYLLLGCVVAAALAAPDVIWQAAHGWPEPGGVPRPADRGRHNRAVYWPAQVLYTGVVLTPLWVTGLFWALRSPAGPPLPAGRDCLRIAIALQFVLGGKPYYPGAVFTFLFAAGAVPLEPRLAARRPLASGSGPRPGGAAMLAAAHSALPVTLSVLPARALHTVPLQKINYDLAEAIAWPKLVALVAHEYGRCLAHSGGGPRSSPGTTAKRARSTATGRAWACPRSSAGPTTSGSGDRRPPPTPRPSR